MSARCLEAKLVALTNGCRGVMSQYLTDNCCIAATRIGIAVLQTLGVRKVRAVLVGAMAYNEPFARGVRDPPAAIIMLDTRPRPEGGLSGHLVIYAKVGSVWMLVDLSAYQMDRPQKGIHVESGVLVPLSGALPQHDWSVRMPLPRGGAIEYGAHPHPEIVDWWRSPNWSLPDREHRELFARIGGELVELAHEGSCVPPATLLV
jgi:hypothetical protein